ncbi:armadillo-like helical domain-containing protein 4 isoform X3 [Rana temporaria]|uniref:armadillo-like helical domain-containing protein 4 isoform X3 n=1 Tax=Rana temporaria TaxID=8407 RepID=UPI001AAD2850|nr:armadillo-like helical domain-containing protein 4 isoform X3 [Rana temporaria]
MKKSLVFHVCGLLCSILLVSPKASCFSLQMLKKRDIQDGNGELVGMGVPESLPGGSLLPTPSTILKDVNVSVILPNVVPIVPEEIQNSSGLLNTSNVNTYPEANNVSVANEAGPSSENGLLTTLGSSTDYPTGVTSLGIPSQGDPKGPSQLPDEKSVNLDQSSLDNSSQVNTIEMLTTNPRTSIFKTEDNQPTTSSPLIGQMITFVNAITSESPTGLGTSTLDNQNNDSLSSTMSQINEEWDDTKGTTQRSDTASSDGITPSPDQVLENESSKTAVFTIHSGVTVPSDDKSVFSTDEKTTEEKLMETDVSPGPDTEDFPTPLPSTAIDGAQAQDFPVYTADVKQPNMDISENTNVTVAPAITMDVSSQETIREPGMIDKAEETAKESTAPQVVIPRNESATASPTTTQALPIEMPSTQSTLNGSLAKDEDDLAGSVSSVVLKAPAETESSTVTAATSVPQASMMAPPARRITATPAFGSDRLESDEGDEEEDEDDEDDEADEDEEDEEDEKDNDSVDDSAERDSDLPLFTLPGLSSQEPLEDDSNVALIEGAAYQVPDTMEWEQQNQGLVRSWMEKLKDKAGYMSGMLVPVGVGIAGALLILGALYSIKIMNRRRRNGFKRHKRKREFNSMQDRVMLLADSSEDEF